MMMEVNKMKKGYIILSAILAIFMSGCSSNNNTDKIAQVTINTDRDIQKNLEEMVKVAPIIVTGYYESLDYRSVNTLESTSLHQLYDEGRVYQFHVTDHVKGQCPNKIEIGQKYSREVAVTDDNAVVDESGLIKKSATESNTNVYTVLDGDFMEPQLEKEYVLFLNVEHEGIYYPGSTPFVIELSNDTAQLKAQWLKEDNLDSQTIENEDGKKVTFNIESNIDTSYQDNITGMSKSELIQQIQTYQE